MTKFTAFILLLLSTVAVAGQGWVNSPLIYGPNGAQFLQSSQCSGGSCIANKRLLCLDPTLASCIFDDFISATSAGSTGWTQAVNGTAAAFTNAVTAVLSGNHIGNFTMTPGTANVSNYASLRMHSNSVVFGGGEFEMGGAVQIGTLSAAADSDYALRLGCMANMTGADGAQGAQVFYDRSMTFTCTGTTVNGQTGVTGLGSCVGVLDPSSIQATMTITGTGIQAATTVSVAPGAGTSLTLSQTANAGGTNTFTFTVGNFWGLETADNSVVSKQISPVAVTASAWHKFYIDVNPAGTSMTGAIDGVSLGTITTNIPITAARPCGEAFHVYNRSYTSGSAKVIDLDYYWHQLTFTTPR